MDKDKLKWYLKEGIKARTYQKRLHIACDFPQDEIEIMIDEIIDEYFPGALAEINNENSALPITDVSNRFILDACCGSRMFWVDKQHPNCLFIDKRSETVEAKDSSQKSGLRTIEVKPDLIADFTEMPFENESFAMVVFDPPHLKTLGQNSWMAKKYGRLPDDWQFMLQKGFKECMRVLKPQGTLIFKWNEHEINSKQVLDLIPYKPLFGHTSGKQAKTIWMAFMKDVS